MGSTRVKHRNSVQRRGRNLALTVEELIASKRLKIAIDLFDVDPMLMRAILIELGMEAQSVAKYKIISEVMNHNGLDRYELKPLLSSITDFNKYNIWWGLSPIEQRYYMLNPKSELHKKEREELFKKLKDQYGVV